MLFPECKDDTLCSFKEMQMLEVECYILAIKDETKKIMMRGFMEMNGIFPDKIFDFYKVYHASVPELNIDRLLYCQKEKSYEGIIFGISHAEVGILTRFMTKNFLNVAMSHQDLYYNLRTLEYLVENYPEKLQNLKYAVIDLFDYTYFNYDTSLSENAAHYYSLGGFSLDSHNFANNKNYDCDFNCIIHALKQERYCGVREIEIDVWEKYFLEYYEFDDYTVFEQFDLSRRQNIVRDDEAENFKYGSILYHTFPNTIEENIKIFSKLMEKLYSINAKMKIYTILIPRYGKVEELEKINPRILAWKKSFMHIIESLQKSYGFEFLDFKNYEGLNGIKMYYQDGAHLNIYGAYTFTKFLEKVL